MGRRGPKPTPTALRLLRNNPGHRPINHDEPKPDVVAESSPLAKCPKWLTGEARALWKRVAPGAIRAGLLTVVDLAAFEALCQSYARWRQAERLTGKDFELAIAKGYRNASVKERQLMMQYGARFGFDPSSRSNVKALGSLVSPANNGPQLSKAERFRLAKTQGA
jgi:P27 family predicted phage terminase small subunit